MIDRSAVARRSGPVPLHTELEQAAECFGPKPFLMAGDTTWTFTDINKLSNSFARYLATRGVTTRDRVAVMLANRPEFLVTINAISRLGAAAVLLSPAWKAFEVTHAVELTCPRHGIVDAQTRPVLAGVLGEGLITDLDAPRDREDCFGNSQSRMGYGASIVDHESVLVFSSGTTGLPKAVRHTHRSIYHGTSHWCAALGLTSSDRFQVATPPSHILGLLNLLVATVAGATVRLHRRFDLDEILHRIATERMTLEMAVAPIALAMANHAHLEDYDLSSLRYIMWGATPVTPSVAEEITSRTGVRWLPAYGASEVPVISANPVAEPSAWRLDSAGLPVAGVQVRVTDLDGAGLLSPGKAGEFQVRSASVMAGYLPDEATADAFDDGWYRTGDIGWVEPEGWLHLTDRAREMIKVKGFQVAPAEIEAILHAHPDVVDCAVFGVPDREAGEVPVAAVKLVPNAGITTQQLSRLVTDRLASYKRLHQVVIVEQIPRLPSGKVLRRELREQWSLENGHQDLPAVLPHRDSETLPRGDS